MSKKVVIIGYSGHAYVICDIFNLMNIKVIGYCENKIKDNNPFLLDYCGNENRNEAIEKIKNSNYFIAIGDNNIRKRICENIYLNTNKLPINAIHPNASISSNTDISQGVMIGNKTIINACAKIKEGVICNTMSIIEHECIIDKYCHIAPGAIICGNVKVGENTFVGAGAVIKQGLKIGSNVTIGAGAVIVKDIPNNTVVVGNPQRILNE